MRLKLSASKSIVATDLAVESVKSFRIGDKIVAGDKWIEIDDIQVALPSTGPVVAVKFMCNADGQRTADTLMLPDFIQHVNQMLGAKLSVPKAAAVK